MATNANPATTYTLDDFKEMQIVDTMTYYNFSILEVINDVEHLDTNLIEYYLPEIKANCKSISLSASEFKKYRYNPDLLAYDIYGSVQLDFIIMLINDILDPKEFTKQTLLLPYSSVLATELNMIYSKEYGYLVDNRTAQGLKMHSS